MRWMLFLMSTGLSLSSCISLLPRGDRACTLEFRYGVNSSVTDARTGAAITNARLTLTEGTYSEEMTRFPANNDYVGAGERAGTYTLTAEASGYVTKVIPGIVVTADECHVTGVRVDVQLEPAQ